VRLDSGDRVLVTGATGFIGSAVTRQLLECGHEVVTLVEPKVDASNLDGLDVKQVVGDVRRAEDVRQVVSGCRAVFHVAALYRFWAKDPSEFYAINVEGTRNMLGAAAEAGVERLVYTSTVGTLGLEHVTDGTTAADERSFPDVRHLYGSYKRSKYVAEHEVLRAIAEGLPASIVLPTFPLGPGDRAPTPTGQLVLDFLNGRMPGFVDTILNVAHVDDVAAGHVLALERGHKGRSYILGGENLTLEQLLGELAAITGLPGAPRPLTRRRRPVRDGRGPYPPSSSVRPPRGGTYVDVSDGLRHHPRPQRARVHPEARQGGPRSLGPLVRRPGHGDRSPRATHHLAHAEHLSPGTSAWSGRAAQTPVDLGGPADPRLLAVATPESGDAVTSSFTGRW
jgi:dihydroflavonol-4-reductase